MAERLHLLAGAAAPAPRHVFAPADLDHIAGDEVPEAQIASLEEYDPGTDLDED